MSDAAPNPQAPAALEPEPSPYVRLDAPFKRTYRGLGDFAEHECRSHVLWESHWTTRGNAAAAEQARRCAAYYALMMEIAAALDDDESLRSALTAAITARRARIAAAAAVDAVPDGEGDQTEGDAE